MLCVVYHVSRYVYLLCIFENLQTMSPVLFACVLCSDNEMSALVVPVLNCTNPESYGSGEQLCAVLQDYTAVILSVLGESMCTSKSMQQSLGTH